MWVFFKIFLGGFIRYWLIQSDYWHLIANRVEVSTPLNSWRRLIEGVYLYEKNIDPYDGDAFHESPIVLITFHWLLKNCPQVVPALFTILDLVTACFVYFLTKAFMETLESKQKLEKETYSKDALSVQLNKSDFESTPDYVLSVYLFSPFMVLNCVGLTTTVLQNLFLAGSLWAASKGHRLIAGLFIAFAVHQALYPVVLVVPISILISKANFGCAKCSYIKTLSVFVLCWSFLIFISAHIMDGSYKYVYSTYGFILSVPDLRPNIGLFWYFFMEMFEHFRLLFLCCFQINALFLYIVPLTLRFHSEPMLLTSTLMTLGAIFRSYPCIGDIGFYLSLLPMWKHLFPFMQQKFIVGCTCILTAAATPTLWHLWIYSRSANANFFFGGTLTFATAEIFLLTDLLFAYMRREFTLRHGFSREIEGKPAKLVLR